MRSLQENETPAAQEVEEASEGSDRDPEVPGDGVLVEMESLPTNIDAFKARFHAKRIERSDRINREAWEETVALSGHISEEARFTKEVLYRVYIQLLRNRGVYNGKKDKENSSITLFKFDKQPKKKENEEEVVDDVPDWGKAKYHYYR